MSEQKRSKACFLSEDTGNCRQYFCAIGSGEIYARSRDFTWYTVIDCRKLDLYRKFMSGIAQMIATFQYSEIYGAEAKIYTNNWKEF